MNLRKNERKSSGWPINLESKRVKEEKCDR
jgi:hypothetical protein